MKAADTKRAAQLVAARQQIDVLVKAAKQSTPHHGYDWRAVEVSVVDVDKEAGGGESSAYLYVDLRTGRRIILAAEAIINEELADLGVTE